MLFLPVFTQKNLAWVFHSIVTSKSTGICLLVKINPVAAVAKSSKALLVRENNCKHNRSEVRPPRPGQSLKKHATKKLFKLFLRGVDLYANKFPTGLKY